MSQNDENEKGRTRSKNIPTNLPIVNQEKIKGIILSFLKLDKISEKIKPPNIAQDANITQSAVRKTMRFLVDIGVITKLGRGEYQLTPEGAKYAKLLNWNRDDEAALVLKELLLESEEIERFLESLEDWGKPISREEGIERYGYMADVPPERDDLRRGIEAVILLLIESGLINEKEGLLSVAQNIFNKPSYSDYEEDIYQEKAEQEDRKRTDRYYQEEVDYSSENRGLEEGKSILGKQSIYSHLEKDESSKITLNINISFEIKEEMNPEWIRAIVRAIKEGWESDKPIPLHQE
ncbi:MAG: hypothetical protein ACFFC7_15875 [Candidatus Hermodarchaeota archaeon]